MNSLQLKQLIGCTFDITIDRPLGSRHPAHDDIIYTANYGYIPGVISGDGEEADVYLLGVDEPVGKYRAKIIALIKRLNDCEDKLVAAPEGLTFSVAEIAEAVHFQEKYFLTEIITDI